MCCIALVRCVLVLRCGSAGVVWCPYAGWSTAYWSTCFECYYIHLQELGTYCGFISCVVLLWFDVCWCYGVVRLGWCGILMQAEAVSNVSTSIFRSLRLIGGFISISRKLLKMDVLTFETCWAVNSEIIKQVTSSWYIFIQVLLTYLLICTSSNRYACLNHDHILFSGTERNGFKILLNELEMIMVLCTGYDQ